ISFILSLHDALPISSDGSSKGLLMTHLNPDCGCPIEAARREELAGRPRVVIVGAGFGGLTAGKALGKAPVHVTLIDRRNHHLFRSEEHTSELQSREK